MPDLKTIVSDLKSIGLSQMQIAKSCGCVQSTISALARGEAETSFLIGTALVALHKKHARQIKAKQADMAATA